MEHSSKHNPSHGNRSSLREKLAHYSGAWSPNWQDYVSMVRDHWYLGLIVGALVAGYYAHTKFQEVPMYRSSATVLFEFDRDRILNIEEVRDTTIRRNPDFVLRSHMVDLRSNAFRERVIRSLSQDERETIIRAYRSETEGEPSLHGIVAAANQIRQMQGNIFAFEFHHRDPQAAALLANRFVEEFDRELARRGREGNDSAIRFLRSQSEELRLRVERGELAVQQYRQERDLVSLEESQNLILQRLKTISGSLNTATLGLLDLQTRVEQLNRILEEEGDPSRLPFISGHPLVAGRLEEKRALERERDILSLRYGRRHPSMIANQTALEVANRQLQDGISYAIANLRETHASATAQVETLQTALNRAEREALELDQVAIDYNVLRRKLAADQTLFAQVHKRLNEAVIASQLASTNMRIVDRAGTPGSPFSPDRNTIITTSVGIFGFFFVGLPIGYGILRGRLKTAAEVESFLEKPFLGDVHRFSRSKVKHAGRLVLERLNPIGVEQFRVLYSQLVLHGERSQHQTIVVTSLIPREGKSFVSSNLAATFSRHHNRVLVIDGDLRRPSMHKQLGLANTQGIINWYKNYTEGDDEKNFTNLGLIPVSDNLDFIPAGGSTTEPTEIIQSEIFAGLMNYLKSVYDVIIIDTPPAGVFSDALCFGEFAEHYLLVTLPNKHPRSVVRSVVRHLDASNASVVGVLFNQMSPRRSRQLGVKYYHYAKYASRYYDVAETAPVNSDREESEKTSGTSQQKT